MKQYKVEYVLTISEDAGMFAGINTTESSGMEIIEATSYLDAQEKMGKKIAELLGKSSRRVRIIPAIKSIELLEN